MADLEVDEPCANCPHTRGEHQPVCVATVIEHQREKYCACPGFEPAQWKLLGYA